MSGIITKLPLLPSFDDPGNKALLAQVKDFHFNLRVVTNQNLKSIPKK